MQKFIRLPILLLMILFAIMVVVIQAQDDDVPPEALIPELVREINLWRINSFVGPVVYNPTLEAMAASQADYLMSLPQIPNDIHAGRQGENARQRSQLPQFAWPTYGHPELFSVSEIAAIGSIRSAMGFWTTSDVHTRSSLNPTYREIGVAARQRGSDILFIVVLGGEPDVLPALADPEEGTLYLTSEESPWQGDWIGHVENYRFLDADENPISEWMEWLPRVDLPDVDTDFFYVQYEDADGKRVTTQVPFQQTWYTGDTAQSVATESAPQVGIFATNTPQGQSIFVTSTPMPTATMMPPTETPRPLQLLRFYYSDDYFTLHNATAGDIDIFELSFRNGNNTFNASRWEAPMADLNISALPSNHCLQLGGVNTSYNVLPVDACRWIRSFVTISETAFFWTTGEFTVLNDAQVIGTCSAAMNTCDITLED